MPSFRQMMRTSPRLFALCFGLACAFVLAVIGAIGGEIYLRYKEKSDVVLEVTIDDAPMVSPTIPPLPEKKSDKSDPPANVAIKIEPSKIAPDVKIEPAKVDLEPKKVEAPPLVQVKETPKPPSQPKIIIPQPQITNDVGNITPDTRKIYVNDPQFGYKHAPNTRGTEIKKKKDVEIYHCTYNLDSLGRRITPHPDVEPERAVIFIGCSFTFGLGVNDDQTMPWQFALKAPNRAVYNYGTAGWGAQHMLELFKTDIEKGIPQKKAIVVYTYIHEHMQRAVGTPKLVKWFAAPFPWYEVDASTGRPVRKGTFKDRGAQPSDTGSKLLDAIINYRSDKLTADDAKLTGLLIDETRVLFEKKFQSEGFYVVLYPNKQDGLTNDMVAVMKAGGAKILDYRDLLGKDKDSWFIPDDGHPKPELHKKVAEKLAEDLLKDEK